MYLDQIPDARSEVKRSQAFGLSATGPKYELTASKAPKLPNVHEEIETLLQYLRDEDLLDTHRPNSAADALPYDTEALRRQLGEAGWPADQLPVPIEVETREPRHFVFESMTATRVVFRPELLDTVGNPKIAVWISDPYEEDLPKEEEPLVYTGTFLYLTEMYMDDGPYSWWMSGFSALQLLADALQDDRIIQIPRADALGSLGRGSADHPIVKLERLGGVITGTRYITSLYTKRYISNEQSFVHAGREMTVCDLLGYPIFIEAHGLQRS
jgi:hypothetical protein